MFQLNSQSSSISSQVGLGLGLQSSSLSTTSSAPVQHQPISIQQQALLAAKESGVASLLFFEYILMIACYTLGQV